MGAVPCALPRGWLSGVPVQALWKTVCWLLRKLHVKLPVGGAALPGADLLLQALSIATWTRKQLKCSPTCKGIRSLGMPVRGLRNTVQSPKQITLWNVWPLIVLHWANEATQERQYATSYLYGISRKGKLQRRKEIHGCWDSGWKWGLNVDRCSRSSGLTGLWCGCTILYIPSLNSTFRRGELCCINWTSRVCSNKKSRSSRMERAWVPGCIPPALSATLLSATAGVAADNAVKLCKKQGGSADGRGQGCPQLRTWVKGAWSPHSYREPEKQPWVLFLFGTCTHEIR